MSATTRLEKLLDDPNARAVDLEAEERREEARLDALKKRRIEATRREQAEREREAEQQRQQAAADAAATQAFDAIVERLRKMLPGADKLAPEVDRVLAVHRASVEALVTSPGADLAAISNRVLWSHPLARLLPLLDQLRSDGPAPERR